MITGLAHTGVCVPDCEAAVAFYRDLLGLTGVIAALCDGRCRDSRRHGPVGVRSHHESGHRRIRRRRRSCPRGDRVPRCRRQRPANRCGSHRPRVIARRADL
ncbi:MAG TPA: VOC family protein [Mycobacterium sp.]|nr:VOC family protein [Mycobacterium sp.]